MPKGRLARPRLTTCRGCGTEFMCERAGRAGWYCGQPACTAARTRARRTQNAEAHRDRSRLIIPTQVSPGILAAARDVIRLAALHPPTEDRFKRTVILYRQHPTADTARLVAGAALALAADLDSMEA